MLKKIIETKQKGIPRKLIWFFATPAVIIFIFFIFVQIKEKLQSPSKPTDLIAKVSWKILNELNLETGEASETLKNLQGKLVRIPGFIVPLEDKQQMVTEFLLVPYAGACIHVPPPPPNQMVHVVMEGDNKVAFTWEPIWITGELMLQATDSPYGKVAFTMKGREARTIRTDEEK